MELKIAILFVEKLVIIFQFLILIKRSEMFFTEKESKLITLPGKDIKQVKLVLQK